jgi:hypothetical protein
VESTIPTVATGPQSVKRDGMGIPHKPDIGNIL